MLWGERAGRRRVVVGFLVLFAVADIVFALAVMREGGGTATASAAALPLHPIAGSFAPDDTRLSDCSDDRCFQQAFGNISYGQGPQAALALVDDVYGSGASMSCHRIVHAIGAAALARFRNNIPRTFAKGSAICGSGYYHGVLERSLVKVRSRTPAALAPVARGLCSAATGMTPWIEYQCLHGLGHGLMIATGLDLPISLAVCARLDRWWDRDACRGGVFMENFSSSYGFTSTWLRDDDPLYPCDWVAASEERRCYQLVTPRVLSSVGGDWDKTAAVCAGVESTMRFMCFRSLGLTASSQSNRDVEEIAETCTVASAYASEGECIFGAAQDIASNFTSGARGAELCRVVRAPLLEPCFTGVGSVAGRFWKTEAARERDCRSLTSIEHLVDACMRGVRSALPRS